MNIRLRWIAVIVGALVIGTGLLLLGRLTADAHGAHQAGYRAGYQAGQSDGNADGLRVGEAQGREEGRALQAGSTLPPDAQAAFTAGYSAGANDAFNGYDGGWGLNEPYLIVLEKGDSQITYRFSSRTTIQSGINYYLCADGHSICQQPRR
jgi:hypothetical protein